MYAMVQQKTYDMALLRIYGATHKQLVKFVAYEALFISLLAYVLGNLLSKIIVKNALNTIGKELSKNLPFSWVIVEEWYLLGVLLAVILLVLVLVLKPVFKLNVSKVLSDEK